MAQTDEVFKRLSEASSFAGLAAALWGGAALLPEYLAGAWGLPKEGWQAIVIALALGATVAAIVKPEKARSVVVEKTQVLALVVAASFMLSACQTSNTAHDEFRSVCTAAARAHLVASDQASKGTITPAAFVALDEAFDELAARCETSLGGTPS